MAKKPDRVGENPSRGNTGCYSPKGTWGRGDWKCGSGKCGTEKI